MGKKKCKHTVFWYMRISTGLEDEPGGYWSKVSEHAATHKVCCACKAQLAWGASVDETIEKMGPDDDWGLGYTLAVEQIAAEIMAGRYPLSALHLEGWKDYWMSFSPAPYLMTLTWHVGWLCAAIADDLRNELGERSDQHTVVRCRVGCSTCGAPMGGFCATPFGFPCPARVWAAAGAANRTAVSLREEMRHVGELVAESIGYVDPVAHSHAATQDALALLNKALGIAESALAPSRHMVP